MQEFIELANQAPWEIAVAIGLYALFEFVKRIPMVAKLLGRDRQLELDQIDEFTAIAKKAITEARNLRATVNQLTQDLESCKTDNAAQVEAMRAGLAEKIIKLENRIGELETDLDKTRKERDAFKKERNQLHVDMVKAQIAEADAKATASERQKTIILLENLLKGFQPKPPPTNGDPKPPLKLHPAPEDEASREEEVLGKAI